MTDSFLGEPIRTRDGPLYINPGTGPVEGATEEHAVANIEQLLRDAGFEPSEVKMARCPEDDEDGRFTFLLYWKCARFCTVDMPGLPLERVRYLGKPQDPWQFPRLYVDGGSWLWCFALSCVSDHLRGEGDWEANDD
jgi:hypothetical protein